MPGDSPPNVHTPPTGTTGGEPLAPDGLFDPDVFRFAGIEVRFGRAVLRYRLLGALWDVGQARPRPARLIEDVIDEVYDGEEIPDTRFRQLCSDTRTHLEIANCPLTIPPPVQGRIQLSAL